MTSDGLLTIYPLLHAFEIEVGRTDSRVPEIDAALRETEKHLQAAHASLKTALTFKPKEEE